MIYQGDQWPEAYRGKLFTLNFHGRRVNVDRLERAGGGYVGRHEPDILFAADPWFRGIDLGYGPDGGVFVLDWSDTGECHEHRRPPVLRPDLQDHLRRPRRRRRRPAKLGERDLVDLHRHPNEWYVRQARRVLADRAARGRRWARRSRPPLPLRGGPGPGPKIRALWALHAIGGADAAFLPGCSATSTGIRAWAIRLLTDALPLDTLQPPAGPESTARRPVRRARGPRQGRSSGLVRLVLASTLQRLPVAHVPRWPRPSSRAPRTPPTTTSPP